MNELDTKIKKYGDRFKYNGPTKLNSYYEQLKQLTKLAKLPDKSSFNKDYKIYKKQRSNPSYIQNLKDSFKREITIKQNSLIQKQRETMNKLRMDKLRMDKLRMDKLRMDKLRMDKLRFSKLIKR